MILKTNLKNSGEKYSSPECLSVSLLQGGVLCQSKETQLPGYNFEDFVW